MEGDTSVLIVPEFMHLDISENRIKALNKCRQPHVGTIWLPETCKSKNSKWMYSIFNYKNKRPSQLWKHVDQLPGENSLHFSNQGDKQPHTFSWTHCICWFSDNKSCQKCHKQPMIFLPCKYGIKLESAFIYHAITIEKLYKISKSNIVPMQLPNAGQWWS